MLASQIKKKAIAGPFKEQPYAKLKINGLMAVERPDGDIRPVLNLLAPACPDKLNCTCEAHCFNDGDHGLLQDGHRGPGLGGEGLQV